ncbi:MAG TPA: hypothetical protein VEJ18_11405, partial [Planctomycetota bacterium]|nr:hypothetical protein [Planctomycetota bacterium]
FWPAWNVLSTGTPFPSYERVAGSLGPAPVGVGRAKGVLDILAALLTTSPYYWSESLGPLLVVGLAGAALFDLRDDGRALATQAGLATAGYLAVLCVALPHYLRGEIHSHVRYLSPVLVPLAAPAAGLLLASARAGPALVRRLGIAALLVAAMALLPLKAGRTVFAVPVAVGAQAASDYLSAKIETFAACEVLNRLPGQVRVLPFILRPYHLDRPWVEGTEFAGVMDAPERFVRALRERSITHVLVEPRVLRPPHEGLFRHAALREVGTGWPHWDGRRIRLYEVVGE